MSPAIFFKAIRIHQWVKNLLLFVPIFMAHQHGDWRRLTGVILGFFAFSLCASSVYLMNDSVDVEADRRHPKKRFRPIASGAMSLGAAKLITAVFLGAAAYLAWLVSPHYLSVLAVYFVATLGYSLLFKQLVLVDIIVLATLYALRILAGGVAADVPVSEWLLVFSIFFFISLACLKRYSELLSLQRRDETSAAGRGYTVGDIGQVGQFGSTSGYLSVLVLALYITSDAVVRLYSKPAWLWGMFPLMLYWVSRLWLLGHRGEVDEDPIVFALRDRTSYVIGMLMAAIIAVSA